MKVCLLLVCPCMKKKWKKDGYLAICRNRINKVAKYATVLSSLYSGQAEVLSHYHVLSVTEKGGHLWLSTDAGSVKGKMLPQFTQGVMGRGRRWIGRERERGGLTCNNSPAGNRSRDVAATWFSLQDVITSWVPGHYVNVTSLINADILEPSAIAKQGKGQSDNGTGFK